MIAPTGATLPSTTATLDILEQRGAHVLALSDDQQILSLSGSKYRLPFARGTPEWLTPLLAVIPGQLCALRLAEARNRIPISHAA